MVYLRVVQLVIYLTGGEFFGGIVVYCFGGGKWFGWLGSEGLDQEV